MKVHETHGGLLIVLEPGDTDSVVRYGLDHVYMHGVNVTIEIHGDTAAPAAAEAIRVVGRMGGKVHRVRAPRVALSSPTAATAQNPTTTAAPSSVPLGRAGATVQAVAKPASAPTLGRGGIGQDARTLTGGSLTGAWASAEPDRMPAPPVHSLGLEKAPPPTPPEPAPIAVQQSATTPEISVVTHSLRSGFRGEYPGTVVVLGDVNSGAQISAGGDIVVSGALRGLAHAGQGGNQAAIVWARPIASVQIRIADAVARSPEEGGSFASMRNAGDAAPEVARLVDGVIILEAARAP